MEVYIIRHGETVWNAAGLLQGRVDIELNENGRQLAGDLGRELEKVSFDRIYASPKIRAYETACLIRGHRNIPIIRDDRLQEISFGISEGSSVKEWLSETSPQRFFFSDPSRYVPAAEGESLEELQKRTAEFLQEVIEPLWDSCRRIMIVAHGASNKGLMCHIQGNTTVNFWGIGLQKNCNASIFNYDGKNWQTLRE